MNRGGSWNNEAANCRAANRNRMNPSNRNNNNNNNNNGFRVAPNSNGLIKLDGLWRMPWDSGWNSSFPCLTKTAGAKNRRCQKPPVPKTAGAMHRMEEDCVF